MISSDLFKRGSAESPDQRLVEECLDGRSEAWETLIDKYKNLIFSIPIKYGLPADDANEIFQEVCLKLLSELPRLRKPQAIAGWLIKVTWHDCVHWRIKERRRWAGERELCSQHAVVSQPNADCVFDEIAREQTLRETISELELRCRRLIQMLFYSARAIPYEEVARHLKIATGSIGSIRMRCLQRLRSRLEEKGFVAELP
jgi:RNA polymerase sigma factor (sigma-70 family)